MPTPKAKPTSAPKATPAAAKSPRSYPRSSPARTKPAAAAAKPTTPTPPTPPTSRAPDVSFRDFQALIHARYFATDSARGVPGTFMWLIEEVGELATALQDNAPGKSPTKTQRDNLREEFADVLAWLTTLANISGVDLAETLVKYTDADRVKGVKS
jgi:NTP pyrophosphatase (non-canonical NTP hydrolase)